MSTLPFFHNFPFFRAEREWQRGETVEAVHQIHGIVPVLCPPFFPFIPVVVCAPCRPSISSSLSSSSSSIYLTHRILLCSYNHDWPIQTLHTPNSQTVTVTATHQISIVIIGPRLAPPSRSRSHWRLSTQHPPLPLTVLRLYPALWSLLPRTPLPLSSLVSSRNSCFAIFIFRRNDVSRSQRI